MVLQEDSIAEEDVAEGPVVAGDLRVDEEEGLEDQDLMAGKTLAQEEGLVVREDREDREEAEVVEEDRGSELCNGVVVLFAVSLRKIANYPSWTLAVCNCTGVIESTGILIP